MQPSRRHCLFASLALLAFFLPVQRAHADDSLTIDSAPAAATAQIDGIVVSTSPYHTNFPGRLFSQDAHRLRLTSRSRNDHASVHRWIRATTNQHDRRPLRMDRCDGLPSGHIFPPEIESFRPEARRAYSSTPAQHGWLTGSHGTTFGSTVRLRGGSGHSRYGQRPRHRRDGGHGHLCRRNFRWRNANNEPFGDPAAPH
jgi:hypothetical protein